MARTATSLQLPEALRPAAVPQEVPGEGRTQAIASEGRGRGRCKPGRDRVEPAGTTQAKKES